MELFRFSGVFLRVQIRKKRIVSMPIKIDGGIITMNKTLFLALATFAYKYVQILHRHTSHTFVWFPPYTRAKAIGDFSQFICPVLGC